MTDGYLSKDREHLAKLHRERGARMLRIDRHPPLLRYSRALTSNQISRVPTRALQRRLPAPQHATSGAMGLILGNGGVLP